MHHPAPPLFAAAVLTFACATAEARAQVLVPGITYETKVTGLQWASAMAFAPDGTLFVCERRTGHVRVVRDGQLAAQPWWSVAYPTPPGQESGLIGIAVDPNYLSNGFVYLFHTTIDGSENRITRVRDVAGSGTQATFVTPPGALPNHPFRIHNGGVMTFGPDGMLYVSTGDAENQFTPQDPTSWQGKILRFQPPNLSFPADNPVPNSPVYAFGIRNTFGLAFHPRQPWLYGSENGYLVGDEINRIIAGGNHGWPQREGPSSEGSGLVDPLLTVDPQPVFTGIGFYQGSRYPAYRDHLFVCQWLQGEVRALRLSQSGNGIVDDFLFADHGHAFGVTTGPDGSLWVLHGPSLGGASEVGRYVPQNGPAANIELVSMSGPVVGGSLTVGVEAPAGMFVGPWVASQRFAPPVPTPVGVLEAPLDALLPVVLVPPSGFTCIAIPVPNVATLVGLDVHAQAATADPTTFGLALTNAPSIQLR